MRGRWCSVFLTVPTHLTSQPIGCGIRRNIDPVGHGEHQRPRVVRLLDDLGHLQLEHVATKRLVGH